MGRQCCLQLHGGIACAQLQRPHTTFCKQERAGNAVLTPGRARGKDTQRHAETKARYDAQYLVVGVVWLKLWWFSPHRHTGPEFSASRISLAAIFWESEIVMYRRYRGNATIGPASQMGGGA